LTRDRVSIKSRPTFVAPADGLNIRWPDGILEQEARILDWKVYAALAYVRANALDRIVLTSRQGKTGDHHGGQVLRRRDAGARRPGNRRAVARDIGLRVYKVAMTWPLEPQGARRFAEGLDEVLVVEEKRQLIEYQIKEELYNWKEGVRVPRVVGKFDDSGEWSRSGGKPRHMAAARALRAFPGHGRARHCRAPRQARNDRLARLPVQERIAFLDLKEKLLSKPRVTAVRQPYFCSGCPHNTSTRVPEGSRATAGIGCHFMAVWMDRSTATFTHMGAEGAPGSARHRLPTRSTSSPTSATAPTTTLACSRSAPRSRPRSP
jgi:indolepyruvate ferredoxin oxidoreductase